jgi:hypothetical protein
MREEVLSSPLAYREGAWHTKQVASRLLLSVPHSLFLGFCAWYYGLSNPTCELGNVVGIGGGFGLSAGIFLTSYKWLGSPKKNLLSHVIL